MAIPKEILELVERFARNRDAYKAGQYNETQLRREFLDPFFKALGWDIDNNAGLAEAYKDVVHEDAIQVGERTKAPDYCFRIGGTRKFFLEAKRPSVDIKNDISPAFQLRRYAWTTKLPISILSDFEEFAVYDCRVKPHKNDKASYGRVFYITFDEYEKRWDEIAGIFSKDAVLKGSFDKFAESNKQKRGTADVDDEFLKTIETWRFDLARNLALRNPDLSQRELNFGVQRIIDRIIFLRICEGRGLEDYGRLQALTNGNRIYPRLVEIFEQADARYNSGLFHFKREKDRNEPPDELTPNLEVDDKLLRDILGSIYYPESPYVFSALSADVLGQVYEQFLGKVIRLTAGHRAEVDDKPEVKKAGGVYYTPTYIVDYIVQNTVGKLLEGKTPKQAAKLTILDPACGSGSFLLGAYEHLLKWHLEFYTKNDPAKWAKGSKPALVQVSANNWKLTIAERKRILLDNIYGVDIDSQAVETTKLSLLLKVLEGETQQSLQPVLRIFHERALPDLGNNIKCGNSLIGPDFYEQQEMAILDEAERYRINVFDWHTNFEKIFQLGGFDAVIGNPPYVQIENILENDRSYFIKRFGENETLGKRYDIYQIFLLRGIDLLRNEGQLGFILPNTFLVGHSYALLRKRLLAQTKITQIVDLPQGVFVGVTVDNVLLFLSRETNVQGRKQNQIAINKLNVKSPKSRVATRTWDDSYKMAQATVIDSPNYEISIHSNPKLKELFGKLEKGNIQLGDVTDSGQGIILYETAEQALEAKYSGVEKQSGWKKLLRGKEIGRYQLHWKGEYLNYGRWLWRAREERFFNQPKILLQAMRNKSLARRLVATFDSALHYNAHNLANIIAKEGSPYDLRYILGLFNSQLINFWYKGHFPNVNINPGDFRQIPIRRIQFTKSSEKLLHDKVVGLVQQILNSNVQLATAKTPHERASLERQITATDAQIDRLVYDLYGVTEDEIKIVEGTATPEATVAEETAAPKPATRKKTAYAKSPPAGSNLTPEKSFGDAAHYYMGKEEPPTYPTEP